MPLDPETFLAPDLYANELALQRRQQLAQALLNSAPPSPQMISGHYVDSPWAHLASSVGQMAGAYLGRHDDEDEASLARQKALVFASMLRAPSANPSPGTPAAGGIGR